jgi:hypothetical protein
MQGKAGLKKAANRTSPSSSFDLTGPGIITYISTLQDDVSAVLSTRLVAPSFEEPAALAVRTLQTVDGQLPHRVWAKFKQADGVVVNLDPSMAASELSIRLLQVVSAFPSTIRRVTLQRVNIDKVAARLNSPASAMEAFFQDLADSACAGSIKHLVINNATISPRAAAMALQHFTKLKVFRAVIDQSYSSTNNNNNPLYLQIVSYRRSRRPWRTCP